MLSVYSTVAATRANRQHERKQIKVGVSQSFAGGCFDRSLANVVVTNVAERPVTVVSIFFFVSKEYREEHLVQQPSQTVVQGNRLVALPPNAGLPRRLEDGDVIVMRYRLSTLAARGEGDEPRLVEVFDAEGGSALAKIESVSKLRREIARNGGGCKNDPMPGPPL